MSDANALAASLPASHGMSGPPNHAGSGIAQPASAAISPSSRAVAKLFSFKNRFAIAFCRSPP